MPRYNEHLIPERNARGFLHMPPVPSTHGGTIKVYESSAADDAYVWVQVNVPADLNDPDGEQVKASVHLTREAATHFIQQLQWLAQHHFLSDD